MAMSRSNKVRPSGIISALQANYMKPHVPDAHCHMMKRTGSTFRPAPVCLPFLVTAAIAVSLVGLGGCRVTREVGGPAPPPQDVTPGSTFTVVKDFLVPGGDSSVYFQDTQLHPQGEIQPNDPFCQFVAGAATAAGEVIRTGVFTVSDVQYDEDGVGPGGMDVSVTEIHLQQASTGTAYRLNCMLPLLSHGARFVTPTEVQGAVGGYMELKVAP